MKRILTLVHAVLLFLPATLIFIASNNAYGDDPATTCTITLTDNSGISEKYNIYVVGCSLTSQKVLKKKADKTYTFQTPTNSSYSAYPILGKEIQSITLNYPTAKTPGDIINGARLYFFILDKNTDVSTTGIPKITSSTTPGSIISQEWPLNAFIELTAIGDTITLDASSVDYQSIPINAVITAPEQFIKKYSGGNAIGNPGKKGIGFKNDKNFNYQDFYNLYPNFIKNKVDFYSDHNKTYQPETGTAINAWNNLIVKYPRIPLKGIILNPYILSGGYSMQTAITTNGKKQADPYFATLFNSELNKFYSSKSNGLSIALPGNRDYFTISYSPAEPFMNSGMTHPAIKLTSKNKPKETVTLFNPVGVSVSTVKNTEADSMFITANGIAGGTKLTFPINIPKNLGKNVEILEGMYIFVPGIIPVQIAPGGVHYKEEVQRTYIDYIELVSPLSGSFTNQKITFCKLNNPAYTYTPGYNVFQNTMLNLIVNNTSYPLTDIYLLNDQINEALNRGILNSVPESKAKTPGGASLFWSDTSNFYPDGKARNLYAQYMHTAHKIIVNPKSGVPEKKTYYTMPAVNPTHPATSATGDPLAMSYGFSMDETPITWSLPAIPGVAGMPEQPCVPSKYDSMPAFTPIYGTGPTAITISICRIPTPLVPQE